MSALLTREGLSDLLRRGVRADLPDAVQAAHECLRDMGVAPTLPAMPRDPKRAARVTTARLSDDEWNYAAAVEAEVLAERAS